MARVGADPAGALALSSPPSPPPEPASAPTEGSAVPSPHAPSRVSVVHIAPDDGTPRRTSRRGEFINLCMNIAAARDAAVQPSAPFVLQGKSAVSADEGEASAQSVWRSEDAETRVDTRRRTQRSVSLSHSLGDLRPPSSPDQLAAIRRLVRETLALGAAGQHADSEGSDASPQPPRHGEAGRPRGAPGPRPAPLSASARGRHGRRQSDTVLTAPVLPPIGTVSGESLKHTSSASSLGASPIRDGSASGTRDKDLVETFDSSVDKECDDALGAALQESCRPEVLRLLTRMKLELKGDRSWMAVVVRVFKAGDDARALESVAGAVHKLCDQDRLADAFIQAGVPRLLLALVRERCSAGGYGAQDHKLFPWLANAFRIVTRLAKRDGTIGRWLRKCGTLAVAIDVLKRHVHSDATDLIGPALSVCCALAGTESHGSVLLQADIVPVVLEAMRRRTSGTHGIAIMSESLQLFARLAGGSRSNLLAFVMKTNMGALLSMLDDALLAPVNSPSQAAVLDILLSVVSIEEGRRAFLDAGGLRRVFDAALRLESCDGAGPLMDRMAEVLRAAAPSFELPVDFDSVQGLIREGDAPLGLAVGALTLAGEAEGPHDALAQATSASMPSLPTAPGLQEDLTSGPIDLFPEMRGRRSRVRRGEAASESDDHDDNQPLPVPEHGDAVPAAPMRFGAVAGMPGDLLLDSGLTASPDPLAYPNEGLERRLVLGEIRRLAYPETCTYEVVYDVDRGPMNSAAAPSAGIGLLSFESRFESGNLHRATMVTPLEYDLMLSPDLSSAPSHNCQWFFFRVSNIRAGCRYVFRIVNMEKPTSQFSGGMQPVVFSTMEHTCNGTGWQRRGSDVCYYRNWYSADRETAARKRVPQLFFTLSFSLEFEYDRDVAYVAYHYPYTHSALQARLSRLERLPYAARYIRRSVLCATLGGIPCDLLTLTDFGDESVSHHVYVPSASPSYADAVRKDAAGRLPLKRRQYVILTSRVHPGESNASWIMDGILAFLLGGSEEAQHLLGRYIFKIVPMLCPDGVVLGCNRYSAAGVDLNRQWIRPSRSLHPTIFRAKAMARFLVSLGKPPFLFCDIHGHSRKKNVFLYGCGGDRYTVETEFPRIMAITSAQFSLDDSSFVIKKDKESTARVVMWRQFRIPRSYTLESSFCGSDRGNLAGMQFAPRDFYDVGRDFCIALLRLHNGPKPGFGGTIFGY